MNKDNNLIKDRRATVGEVPQSPQETRTFERVKVTLEDIREGVELFKKFKEPLNGQVFLTTVSVPSLSVDGFQLSSEMLKEDQTNLNQHFGFMVIAIEESIKTNVKIGDSITLNTQHLQGDLNSLAAMSRTAFSDKNWDIKMDNAQFETLASTFKEMYLKNLKKQHVFVSVPYSSLACILALD